MTWLLVSTVPEAVMIMPVPSSPPADPLAVMSTVAGSTRAAMEETLRLEPGGPLRMAVGSREPEGLVDLLVTASVTPAPAPPAMTMTATSATTQGTRRERDGSGSGGGPYDGGGAASGEEGWAVGEGDGGQV